MFEHYIIIGQAAWFASALLACLILEPPDRGPTVLCFFFGWAILPGCLVAAIWTELILPGIIRLRERFGPDPAIEKEDL